MTRVGRTWHCSASARSSPPTRARCVWVCGCTAARPPISPARGGRCSPPIADGNGYYVRLAGRRGVDLDLGAEGRLAYFALTVQDVQEDSADYARLTSGVTFELKQPAQVVPRWEHTLRGLRAAAS
jgi:hypothetical protein